MNPEIHEDYCSKRLLLGLCGIDGRWIHQPLSHRLYAKAGSITDGSGNLPEKAGAEALVTRGPLLMHLQQDGVGIAVYKDRDHLLAMAAFFSLAPEAIATAAEVDGIAGGHGFRKGLGVHPSHHEDIPIVCILGNRWEQSPAASKIRDGSLVRRSRHNRDPCKTKVEGGKQIKRSVFSVWKQLSYVAISSRLVPSGQVVF